MLPIVGDYFTVVESGAQKRDAKTKKGQVAGLWPLDWRTLIADATSNLRVLRATRFATPGLRRPSLSY
jgi:hypothetical protein